MPTKAKVPCQHPWCSALVPVGQKYCEKHKPLHRPDPTEPRMMMYDSKWRKARARFLAAHPVCVMCEREGRLTPATVVDHVIPHRGDKRLFWDESNWQPLCKPHHDRKTLQEDIRPEYGYRD